MNSRTIFIALVNIFLAVFSSGSSAGGSQGLNLLVLFSSRAQPVMVGGRPLLVLRRGHKSNNPTSLNSVSVLFNARYSPSSSAFIPTTCTPLVWKTSHTFSTVKVMSKLGYNAFTSAEPTMISSEMWLSFNHLKSANISSVFRHTLSSSFHTSASIKHQM